MERLTKRDHEGLYYPYCFECCHGHPDADACLSCTFEGTIIERLAAYEDTGLEPDKLEEMQNDAYDLGYQSCLNYKGLKWPEAEELQHYREAEQEGRLVVMPCKVGDVVYKPVHGIDGDGVWEIKVEIIDYDWHPDGSMTAHAIGTVLPDHGGTMLNMADFGKDWFLTREEAERMLEGGQKNAAT